MLARGADRLVGKPEAALVINDTAWPKQGAVGGRCATTLWPVGQEGQLPGPGLADVGAGEVPVRVALGLLLPGEWTRDPRRCVRAGVPEAEVVERSKGEIALARPVAAAIAGERPASDAAEGFASALCRK